MLLRLPNILSLSRIIAAPIIIANFYLLPQNLSGTTNSIIFLFAGITDFLDGYIARKYNLGSKLGSILDPIADKVLVTSTLILLVHTNQVHLIPAIIIIVREIIISGIREAIAGKNSRLPVFYLAKLKTALQMVAIFLLLASYGNSTTLLGLGSIAIWSAALLASWSCVIYLKAPASEEIF